jgi:hypothetical protein
MERKGSLSENLKELSEPLDSITQADNVCMVVGSDSMAVAGTYIEASVESLKKLSVEQLKAMLGKDSPPTTLVVMGDKCCAARNVICLK